MSFQAISEAYLIPAHLALAMLGMGATLTVQEFINVLRDAKGLVIGLGLQLVFIPLLAMAFIRAFGLSPGWAVGLLLIAVVPSGAYSNLLTYLGKGNIALSVSLTIASNVICLFTIPLLLNLLVVDQMPADFKVPTVPIVTELLGYLLIPLAIGMVVRRANPRASVPFGRWAIVGSLVLLACAVVSSLGSGRIRIAEYGWKPPLLLILFGSLLSLLSAPLCRLLGRYDDDTMALTSEVVVRNISVALILVKFFFPGESAQGHVLYSCLFYAGASFVFGIPVAAGNRWGLGPLWPLQARPRPMDAKKGARAGARSGEA